MILKTIIGRNRNFEVALDEEDEHFANKTSLWLTSRGYVELQINGTHYLLHRLIMRAEKGQYVDHINHDKLDNRRSNLRVCTQSQNLGNRNLNTNNKTGFKGVSKFRDKWRVYVAKQYVGVYPTLEEASNAYNQAALGEYGEFAKLN